MTNRSRSLVACALAMSGLLAVACDEPTTGTDGGPNPMMDGGPGPGTDGGPGTDSGPTPDTDGGPTPGDCAGRASAYCDRFEECNPNGFIGAYENMDICVEVVTDACENPDPLAPQPADPAACAATQAGSCDAFLVGFAEINPACLPAPGSVGEGEDCYSQGECGTHTDGRRLYCRGTTACNKACYPAQYTSSTRGACTGALGSCDTYAGFECVDNFDEDLGVDPSDGAVTCLEVERGGTGADCYPGSDRQCATGFVCHVPSKMCMAALGVNAACNPAAGQDLCDARLGLSCTDVEGVDLCRRSSIFVQVGAESGTVDGVTQNCSAYALPSTETPPRCELRRRLDETCSATRANCWPGLTCESGTCQEPEPGAACD